MFNNLSIKCRVPLPYKPIPNTQEVVNGSTAYDLCPECMEKFLTFIAKGENK